MCVTICGRFCPDEGVVVGYDNRIRVKYTAKWGVQIAGMIFQTGSSISSDCIFIFEKNLFIFILYVEYISVPRHLLSAFISYSLSKHS